MIYHIISECRKLEQKEYKSKHDWVGKAIQWELFKKSKFDHTSKSYMHHPEFVLENEIHEVLLDFEIQTDHLISARPLDQLIVKKKKGNMQNSGLYRSNEPLDKTERKR